MTISDSDFAALRADVDKILVFMGDMDIRHAADIAKHEADPSSWPILDPSGDHSVAQDRHLLREWQNQHANIAGQIAALENKPPSVVEGEPGPKGDPGLQGPKGPPGVAGSPGGSGVSMIPGLGEGIVMYAGGPYPNLTALLFHGGDRGVRWLDNHRPAWDGQPTHSDPNYRQLRFEFEQDGAISMGYVKPLNVPAGPYDALPDKAILFRPGGVSGNNTRGKYVQIYGGQPGRGMQIGIARNIPNVVEQMDIEIDPDNASNPVKLKVEGTPQRVVVKVVNGVKVFAPE